MDVQQVENFLGSYGLGEQVEFAIAACAAVEKLRMLKEQEQSPIMAFNEFISAWVAYSDIPEVKKRNFERVYLEFNKEWEDVAKALVSRYFSQSASVKKGDVCEYDNLCITCMQIIEALANTDGNMPDTVRLYEDALELAEDKTNTNYSGIALLYILCARLWGWSLMKTPEGDEAFLRKAYQNHIKASCSDGLVYNTEMYAFHIAAAIISLVLYKGGGAPDLESRSMIAESYRMLCKFKSPKTDFIREQIYTYSGIQADGRSDLNEMSECDYFTKKRLIN